jgi:hypothetical protein
MAYDGTSGRLLLFGGLAGGVPLNDTWLWDGSGWTLAAPRVQPPARAFAALGSVPPSGPVLLFGGQGPGGGMGDAWLWQGGGWAPI